MRLTQSQYEFSKTYKVENDSHNFTGKKLDRKDLFGSSDPFLQFSRSSENGNYVVVHRTEHIKVLFMKVGP